MAYCRECGRDIAAGAKFCPECGAQQAQAAPSSAKVETRQEAPPKIPGTSSGKWVSYLGFVAGISVAVTGSLFFLSPGPLEFALGMFFLLTGVAAILFGYGFWHERSWAWSLGVIAGVFYIVAGTFLVYVFILAGVAGVIFGTLVVSYLQRPDVKARLGRIPK